VAMLSHELRTPLTGVSAYLELLERELRPIKNQRAHRYAERALAQSQRFGTLVADLFDAHRLQRGRMTFSFAEVDLRDVVDEAAGIARPLAGAQRIVVHRPRRPVILTADPERLQQVVINLLSNAIQHAASSPDIDVRIRRRGDEAEISVADHGPGMSNEVVAGLWSQAPAEGHDRGEGSEGLGLGLYIARLIVEAHGGRIGAASIPGKGSTFTVHLPLRGRGAPALADRPAG